MLVVVGLGNPGPRYADTRHNAGAWVLTQLGEQLGARWSRAHGCLLGHLPDQSRQLLLARPLSYMNNSGFAVRQLLAQLGPASGPGQLLVVHDDLDLPPGRIRIRAGGTSGGHRGVDSIIYHLADDSFYRLKVGVGRPDGALDSAEYVLLPPDRHQQPALRGALLAAADAVLCLADEGLEAAQNRFNGREWGP